MASAHTGNQQPSIDLEEHRSVGGVNAKAVVPYSSAGAVLTPAPTPLIDLAYDYVGFSNVDGNGNYRTISLLSGGSGGVVQRILNLTYDANSNVTSIART